MTPADEQPTDPSAEPIWSRMQRPHLRRPTLEHSQIATAGVRIADRDGLDALSMRKVAQELGVGTMSLYRYIANKNELIDLMVDSVNAELGLGGAASGGWRDVLTEIAHSSRRMVRSHPWAAGFGSRPSLGPNTLAWIEESMARLDHPELTIDQVMDMTGTVTSFVTGFVQYELDQQRAQQESGMTEQEWRSSVGPYLQRLLDSDRYPFLQRIVIEAEDFPDSDDVFERRLGYVLDGLGSGLGLD